MGNQGPFQSDRLASDVETDAGWMEQHQLKSNAWFPFILFIVVPEKRGVEIIAGPNASEHIKKAQM